VRRSTPAESALPPIQDRGSCRWPASSSEWREPRWPAGLSSVPAGGAGGRGRVDGAGRVSVRLQPAGQPAGPEICLVLRLARENPAWDTAGCTASCAGWVGKSAPRYQVRNRRTIPRGTWPWRGTKRWRSASGRRAGRWRTRRIVTPLGRQQHGRVKRRLALSGTRSEWATMQQDHRNSDQTRACRGNPATVLGPGGSRVRAHRFAGTPGAARAPRPSPGWRR